MIEAVDDGLLALTELVITEMACEPFSILEFESAYLRALDRTTSWEVSQCSQLGLLVRLGQITPTCSMVSAFRRYPFP